MIPKHKPGYIKDALFISYTGLKDFLKCPRSYYLKNRYRNADTNYRIQIPSAHMTLGSLVHDAIKWYLQTNRTASYEDVVKKFRNHWGKYRGKRGGFKSLEEEAIFGKRGLQMLDNFMKNAAALGPNLPAFDFMNLKVDEKIVLTGKLDFLGNLEDETLHVLDFKTGIKEEDDPIQLHTYAILAEANLQKPVSKISYWYIDKDVGPKEAVLDNLEVKLEWIKKKCKGIEEAISEGKWVCVKGEDLCYDCKSYQAIVDGKGEFLFTDEDFKKDIYFLEVQSR